MCDVQSYMSCTCTGACYIFNSVGLKVTAAAAWRGSPVTASDQLKTGVMCITGQHHGFCTSTVDSSLEQTVKAVVKHFISMAFDALTNSTNIAIKGPVHSIKS